MQPALAHLICTCPGPAALRRLGLHVLLLGGIVTGAAQAAEPLSEAERRQLVLVASQVPWYQANVRSTNRQMQTGPDHPLGVQTLGMDPETGKSARQQGLRRARVYQYDHTLGVARQLDVELPGGKLLRRVDGSSVHLPLSPDERLWAHQAYLASGLYDARATARATARFSAFVYEPRGTDDPCHARRCALLALYSDDGAVLALEPVVEFADGAVRALPSGRP